ncbi:MAG: mitochondrial fission ELM1 family protein [Neomegalonema sp.]|nr:mitochondrial fission ELM1 family protein [Neomegalonema sp.]
MTTLGQTADTRRIWVVTDGRAGNENPARGLAERLQRRLATDQIPSTIDIHRIDLKGWATLLPAPAWPLFGRSAGGWPFSALGEGADLGERAADPALRPDLVIGAGRRAAPVVAALGGLASGAIKTVQLLNPKMDPRLFDLTIAPQHDGPSAPRRLATVGSLHRIDPDLPPAPDPRLPTDKRPRIALLIGGKSKSAAFGAKEVNALLEAIGTLGALDAGIAATASRRTPAADAEKLQQAVEAAGGFFWGGGGENPYLPMLFWADALIVTADSVNMASEACALGKPVYVAPSERLAPKFSAFHNALRAGGHARELARGLERGELADWRPTPLDDMAAAVAAVRALLAV